MRGSFAASPQTSSSPFSHFPKFYILLSIQTVHSHFKPQVATISVVRLNWKAGKKLRIRRFRIWDANRFFDVNVNLSTPDMIN